MKLFLPVLLFLSQAAFGQGTLEVIPLRYRTADHVIPVLRPLLEPGGALSGQFNQLIVRASPANLAQIRQALEAIDQPQRRLTISVRFDSAEDRVRGGGRLGEWIELGGASGILSSAERLATEERRIWVKVEEIR